MFSAANNNTKDRSTEQRGLRFTTTGIGTVNNSAS
jgi:hypothetical protein